MFISVDICTDITDILPGGNLSGPMFLTMGSMFDDAVLVHKLMHKHILLPIDIPVATYYCITLPNKP